MRIPFVLLLATTLLPATAQAQLRLTGTLGATGGTGLVNDHIYQDIEVRQSIAPTVTLGAALPVGPSEYAGLEIGLGFATTTIVEPGQPDLDGPGFSTLTVTGNVDGALRGPLRWRGTAGLIKYLPDEEGIFRQGGPLLLLVGIGVDGRIYSRGAITVSGRLRYDYHRFTTDELTTAGFSRSQSVHRLGLGLVIDYLRK